MIIHLPILNAFIEDTCVIAVIAYLIARGRILAMMFSSHLTRAQRIALGALFGLVGISELVFPGARAPYVVHTLLVSFSALTSGLYVGVSAALVIAAGSLVIRAPIASLPLAVVLLFSATIGVVTRRTWKHPGSLVRAGATAALCQAMFVLASHQFHISSSNLAPVSTGLFAALANGLGGVLLQLIFNEAQMRNQSEYNRIAAERSQAMAAEAQLMSLRARVHPHFLFNALTSIAALCTLAPEKAERAVVQLSLLMRRALAVGPSSLHPLSVEIDHVRAYLDIEQHRMGDRLCVDWQIDSKALSASCPPFCVQMLVENAINHGIAPSINAGSIQIRVVQRNSRVAVVVIDNGLGIPGDARRTVLTERNGQEHGLVLLNRQLELQFGHRSRLHLFSSIGKGTLVGFQLPVRAWK